MMSYEPHYTKTYLRAYVDSEGPDQLAHPPSLSANRIIVISEVMNGEQNPG